MGPQSQLPPSRLHHPSVRSLILPALAEDNPVIQHKSATTLEQMLHHPRFLVFSGPPSFPRACSYPSCSHAVASTNTFTCPTIPVSTAASSSASSTLPAVSPLLCRQCIAPTSMSPLVRALSQRHIDVTLACRRCTSGLHQPSGGRRAHPSVRCPPTVPPAAPVAALAPTRLACPRFPAPYATTRSASPQLHAWVASTSAIPASMMTSPMMTMTSHLPVPPPLQTKCKSYIDCKD